MNTIYNTYKASEEGFDEIMGKVPETALHIKGDFCVMCGQPWEKSKQVLNLKSFNRTSALALLESVREMIEGEKCKSCLEGLTNPSCGYNEPLNEIITLISQAEQLITHKCCNGECNHDDCCGKVEANCPLKQ